MQTETNTKQQLSLFDSVCLIVGIIVGAGIYKFAPAVAEGAQTAWNIPVIWLAGGLLSLMGACCYAELATRYPRTGGDVVYLTKAYGRWSGFLFGWVQLSIIRPCDIAAMSLIFAEYGSLLFVADDALNKQGHTMLVQAMAIGGVLLLTAIHVLGVREGKWTQNILTLVKVAGVLLILGLSLLVSKGDVNPETVTHKIMNNEQTTNNSNESNKIEQHEQSTANEQQAEQKFKTPLSLALIFVLFTFGGWSEIVYVAAEVKNPQKNIVYAIVTGIAIVTALYLLLNGAFLQTLGYSGLTASQAVATDTAQQLEPAYAGRLISCLIAISALGSASGLIFTGARISYAVGEDHHLFALLHRWNRSRQTPVMALLLQGAIAIALVLIFGSILETVILMASVVYLFYLATTLSVIVLRWKDKQTERAFKVPGYPFTPLLFAGVCGWLMYSSVTYDYTKAAVAGSVLLIGIPLYFFSEWLQRKQQNNL